MSTFIMLIAFFVIFFFVFYLPNKKKEPRNIDFNINNEKILIKSKGSNKKKTAIFLCAFLGGGFGIVAFLILSEIAQGRTIEPEGLIAALFSLPIAAFFTTTSYLAYISNFIEIIVTDKRICVINTKTNILKELPFDQISSAIKKNNIIRISSSSENISIFFCPDIDAVFNVISNQLKEVQTKHVIVDNTVATAHSTQSPEPKDNNVEKLREYKKLLDEGIITPEEFEIKKKQLLDL